MVAAPLPFGVGIAVYTVLAGLGVFPPVTLVAAIMAVVQVQNVCDPTNTQNVWVANFTGIGVERITRLTLPWQVGVATIATIVAVIAGVRLFGVAPFAPRAAAAATMVPGLFAPPSAARAVAVVLKNGGDFNVSRPNIKAFGGSAGSTL